MMSNTSGVISAKSFITSVLKFSVASWVNFLISIVSVTIITRVFNPDTYGTLNIFNSASNLLMGIACLGLDSSFLRFYNEPPSGYDAKQLLVKCMGIPVVFLLGMAVITMPLFYSEISTILFNKISLVITILLCANALAFIILNFFANCYRMRNDARNYTIQSILLQFFSKCFVISAALIDPNTTTVIIFNTTGVIVLTIVYFYIQRKEVLPRKINWSFSGFSEIMKFAALSWPIVIIIHLNTFLSQFIISTKLGNYELGIYASAGLFVGVLGVLQNGFRTYWAAFMYANYNSEQEKIKRVHDYVLLLVVVIMAAFVVFQNVLYSLLGDKYHESRYFFTLVLIYPLFQIITETTAYGITIAKKTQYSLFIILLSTIVNAVGCYVLVPLIGIVGAAVASMASAILYLVLSTLIGQRYYTSISQTKKTFITVLMILLIAITNCIYINNYRVELSIILVTLMVTTIYFRKEMYDCVAFIRDNLKRNLAV